MKFVLTSNVGNVEKYAADIVLKDIFAMRVVWNVQPRRNKMETDGYCCAKCKKCFKNLNDLNKHNELVHNKKI